jgi:hypothetical protein
MKKKVATKRKATKSRGRVADLAPRKKVTAGATSTSFVASGLNAIVPCVKVGTPTSGR